MSNGVSSSKTSFWGVLEYKRKKCGCAVADSVMLSSHIDGSCNVLMALLTRLYVVARFDWVYAISALIELLSLMSLIYMYSPCSLNLFGVFRGTDWWWGLRLKVMSIFIFKTKTFYYQPCLGPSYRNRKDMLK